MPYQLTRLNTLPILCLLAFSPGVLAHDGEEKKQLQHSDYGKWKTIVTPAISGDGKWAFYTAKPGKGDAVLHVRQTGSAKEYVVPRGKNAKFGHENHYIFYIVSPDPELIKKLKKEKKPDLEIPTSRLEILHLESGRKKTVANVSSFSLLHELHLVGKPVTPSTGNLDPQIRSFLLPLH